MNNIQIEVCAGSYEDCLAAFKGGAKRVELNSALALGGLSPTTATLKKVKEDTDLKVICMVRPRGAGFCYSDLEKEIMFAEAEDFLKNGADGIAFGFLNPDGTVDEKATQKMIDLIHSFNKEAVFHRAIDVTPDYKEAVKTLCALKADRILTSGQKEKALEGIDAIGQIQELYGDQIEILAGSGVNAGNAREILEKSGIHQIHSSCKGYCSDPTTSNGSVSYSYLSDDHKNDYDVVMEELVEKLVKSIQ